MSGKVFSNCNPGGVYPRSFASLHQKEIATVVAKNISKRQTKKSQKFNNHLEHIQEDVVARQEGPQIKRFHIKDLKEIHPLTDKQTEAFDAWDEDYNLFLSGSAGTGKTFLACYMALEEALDEDTPQNKVVIVRSAQQSLDLGYLPGNLEEKLEAYEAPYIDIFGKLLRYKTAYESAKATHLVEFHSTSFLRGMNLDNCIVVMDEVQNSQFNEIHLVMTRLGENSKIIICGDVAQTDLKEKRHQQSCIIDLTQVIDHYMPSFKNIRFTMKDCVRSGLCREWLEAIERTGLL